MLLFDCIRRLNLTATGTPSHSHCKACRAYWSPVEFCGGAKLAGMQGAIVAHQSTSLFGVRISDSSPPTPMWISFSKIPKNLDHLIGKLVASKATGAARECEACQSTLANLSDIVPSNYGMHLLLVVSNESGSPRCQNNSPKTRSPSAGMHAIAAEATIIRRFCFRTFSSASNVAGKTTLSVANFVNGRKINHPSKVLSALVCASGI